MSTDISVHQLNNDYSIQVVCESNSELKIELYRNQVKINCVLLNDNQCSTLTHQFCQTVHELYEVLIDLLLTRSSSETNVISIRMMDDKHLKIWFPVHFGSGYRSKLWSFSVEFPHLPHDHGALTEEFSLDPLDWDETRSLGHRIVDDMVDYLRDIRMRPVWRPMPLEVKKAFGQADLPLKGQSPWQVYNEVCSLVLPYTLGNNHPCFWGYIAGATSPIGAFAEFITGTINTVAWGGHQSSTYMESQVLSWLKMMMGFPDDDTCSGILVSGTSMATIIALAVAKKKFHNRSMKIYHSRDVHSCLVRAAALLSIEKQNLIVIPTNEQHQIDLKVNLNERKIVDFLVISQALKVAVDPDACGFIVGTAGTTGTGAIDELQGLADLRDMRPQELWFHIDGALGAVACCSSRLRPLFAGLERADSLAFDLHKWLSIPYECGCILIRDGQLHKLTFSHQCGSYLTLMDGGLAPSVGELYFSDLGIELSRNMKSLKVWMTLKTYGLERFGHIMEQNVDQAMRFATLIKQHSNEFELLNTVSLNIVCFRYVAQCSNGFGTQTMNSFNKRLLVTIQERGIAFVSPYVFHNHIFALRMCITNHRTRLSDMDRFLEQIMETAHGLLDTAEFSILKDK